LDHELPVVLAEVTRRLHWAITRGGDHGAEPLRERRGQVRTMHVLADGSELTMNDLANRLQVAPPTVTGLVRNLVEQGYVTRTNDESDWRIVRVAITDSGREALSQHRQGVLDRMSGWLSELEPAEIEDLNSAMPALRRLSRILEAQQLQTGEPRARNS
jgi:DNA-binding MarR family transcriptional regulator